MQHGVDRISLQVHDPDHKWSHLFCPLQGPAPENLAIPPYEIDTAEGKLLIG